ncbi:MAG: ATP-grasp domain-containing protein [candidate division NC10 bacterium]|nr:ATP-grasp domain-containing protein [candidate division NC10 bacterium]
MDRLLLLMTTTTYRAGAFLEAARRLDVPVVVGSDCPQVLAAANPGGTLTVNFLDPDEGSRTIAEFTWQYPIRAVIAADDDGVILAAAASAAPGLPHNPVEAVSAARNKYRMREVLAAAGIPTPRFRRISIDENPEGDPPPVPFPCVLKPLALSASRGVIRADHSEEFIAAFHRIAAILRRPEVMAQGGELGREILVETFLPGVEVAVEGLLSEGRLRVLAVYDKPDPLDGPFFEETIYVTPSRLPAAIQEKIVAHTAEAVKALGLWHGPIHAELRVNDQGPWVLEIAPRSIGGLCSRTLRFGDGISLEELILRHALGRETESCERERQAAGVMMIPIPHGGILREVRGKEAAESVDGIEEIRITIPLGQEVVPVPEGARYLGFIFARGETPEGVEAALREAHRRLAFVITPDREDSGEMLENLSAGRGQRANRRIATAG